MHVSQPASHPLLQKRPTPILGSRRPPSHSLQKLFISQGGSFEFFVFLLIRSRTRKIFVSGFSPLKKTRSWRCNRFRFNEKKIKTSMATRGFVLYLLSGFSLAILSVFFLNNSTERSPYQPLAFSANSTLLLASYGSSNPGKEKVWPVCLFLFFCSPRLLLFSFSLHVYGKVKNRVCSFFY